MPPCESLSKAAYLAVLNIYYANHRASPVAQQQKKESTCNAGDTRGVGLIPGSGTCPGGGNGNPLQYSCLENPLDREAWQATVQGGHKESGMTEHLSTHATHRQEDKPDGFSRPLSLPSLCNTLSSFLSKVLNYFLKLTSYLLKAEATGRNYVSFQSAVYQPYSHLKKLKVKSHCHLCWGKKEIWVFTSVNAKTKTGSRRYANQLIMPVTLEAGNRGLGWKGAG